MSKVSVLLAGTQSVQFSRSFTSDSLRPRGPQHTRPPCPSPTPRVYPNSCPLSQWCHPTISSSVVPFSSCLQSFPASGSFPMSRIRWPKYWSFSFNISPSNEHSGLIFFRMDSFDLLAVQGPLKSLLQHYSSKASILQCSAFFIVQLSHPYMTTGKTIALTRQTFVGNWLFLVALSALATHFQIPLYSLAEYSRNLLDPVLLLLLLLLLLLSHFSHVWLCATP